MWVNLDISKSSLWVWNYLTWLWLFCFISRLSRDIYLNWVAAEILKVAAGNFAVRFTTQLIACPFKTDSFHTTPAPTPQPKSANTRPLAYMNRSMGLIFISYNFANYKSSAGWRPHHIYIFLLCALRSFSSSNNVLLYVWCLGFWLYKLLNTNFFLVW